MMRVKTNAQSCHYFDTLLPRATCDAVNMISRSKSNRTCSVDIISGVVHKVKQMMYIAMIIYSMLFPMK